MYSQCPECLTRFRVTAAVLRAAHGTVRCGRCGSAFDALPRLSDTLQDDTAGPAQPPALQFSNAAGLTAAGGGLPSADEAPAAPEFHFSADDIEQVFIDARDWQSRFGTSSSPGDRAGRMGDTTTADLSEGAEVSDGNAPASDEAQSPVWVHEPETVEDITLEGERIQIQHFGDFEEDYLEREIENALEEQHRAETAAAELGAVVADQVPPEAVPEDASAHDLDSTDRFEIIREVPESAHPREEPDIELTDSTPALADTPAVVYDFEAFDEKALVAAPAEEPAVVTPITTAEPSESVVPIARAADRWQRPAAPRPAPSADDELTALDEDDFRLAEELAAGARERRVGWAWGGGALLMGLLLAAQLAHHFRQPLSRDASVGPVLREIYSRLGHPLAPSWNLGAFELRQWGATESAPSAAGSMTVRASIRNGAAFAQPLPLLRLELDDRFGGIVARRDFRPGEYLKDPAQATRLLAAGAATEAELAIVDATTDAVGYRLDVCMREESGAVRCAQPAAVPAGSEQASQ